MWDTILSIFQVVTHFIILTTLAGRHYYYYYPILQMRKQKPREGQLLARLTLLFSGRTWDLCTQSSPGSAHKSKTLSSHRTWAIQEMHRVRHCACPLRCSAPGRAKFTLDAQTRADHLNERVVALLKTWARLNICQSISQHPQDCRRRKLTFTKGLPHPRKPQNHPKRRQNISIFCLEKSEYTERVLSFQNSYG